MKNQNTKPMFDLGNGLKLYLDKVLFETFEPLFFTCVDDGGELYICVCCQPTRKWLITKTTPQIIVDVLQNKITLREAFISLNERRYSVNAVITYNAEINNKEDWDVVNSHMLPTAGEYMDAEVDEFSEEIEYYEKQIRK